MLQTISLAPYHLVPYLFPSQVDNLFVFVLVFKYFKTPLENQNKVLQYGIYSAAILRGIMIIAGVSIIEDFQPALLVFAGILLFSSFKLLSAGQFHHS